MGHPHPGSVATAASWESMETKLDCQQRGRDLGDRDSIKIRLKLYDLAAARLRVALFIHAHAHKFLPENESSAGESGINKLEKICGDLLTTHYDGLDGRQQVVLQYSAETGKLDPNASSSSYKNNDDDPSSGNYKNDYPYLSNLEMLTKMKSPLLSSAYGIFSPVLPACQHVTYNKQLLQNPTVYAIAAAIMTDRDRGRVLSHSVGPTMATVAAASRNKYGAPNPGGIVAAAGRSEAIRLVADSGASIHTVGDGSLLLDLRPLCDVLTLADGRTTFWITGVGRIELEDFSIPNVSVVEGLGNDKCFISIGQLDREHGLVSCFGNGVGRIMMSDGTEVGGAFLDDDGMYVLRYLEVPAAGGPPAPE